MSLTRQRIITSSVFKFGDSSLTWHLPGYRVTALILYVNSLPPPTLSDTLLTVWLCPYFQNGSDVSTPLAYLSLVRTVLYCTVHMSTHDFPPFQPNSLSMGMVILALHYSELAVTYTNILTPNVSVARCMTLYLNSSNLKTLVRF
jgi:hypothetical protein